MRVLEKMSVGGLILRNRIVMPPMNTGFATESGEVTEKMIQHYAARAPWVGMVIVEHSYVRPDGKYSPKQLGIYEDRLRDGLCRLAKAVKQTGARVAIQINHAGMNADPTLIDTSPIGPSALDGARELAVEELKNLTEAFGNAARRAVSCGFDAVEIHGAHGYLLNQFASPLTNRRNDDYGGSLQKRMRIPLEVVRRVRQESASKAQLWYRLGADDRMEGGNSVEDGAKIAKLLAAERVDVIDVSGGFCGDSPAGLEGPGFFAYAARRVKDATGLPVVAVGGVKTADQAESVLEEWGVDLVAVGRALLADPMWGKSHV